MSISKNFLYDSDKDTVTSALGFIVTGGYNEEGRNSSELHDLSTERKCKLPSLPDQRYHHTQVSFIFWVDSNHQSKSRMDLCCVVEALMMIHGKPVSGCLKENGLRVTISSSEDLITPLGSDLMELCC